MIVPSGYKVAWIFLFLGIVALVWPVARAKPLIGYGCSTAVIPLKNQEFFYMGFEMGLKLKLKRKFPDDFLATERSTDGSSLGAVKVAQALIKKGVVALVGFTSSHEALLGSKEAVKQKMLFISAGSGHTKMGESGPSVFSVGFAMRLHVAAELEFLRKRFAGKKGYIISYPEAVFSMNHEEVFLKTKHDRRYDRVRISPLRLGHDRRLSKVNIEQFKKEKPDYLVITPYADEAANLLFQLKHAKIDVPILTNFSWTTVGIELLRRALTYKKEAIYSTVQWKRGTEKSKAFEKLVKDTYGREATTEMAGGYELGVIIATLLDRVEGPITKSSFLNALHKNRCFDDTLTKRLCFPAKGGHPYRKAYVVRFTVEKGFVPVEPQ